MNDHGVLDRFMKQRLGKNTVRCELEWCENKEGVIGAEVSFKIVNKDGECVTDSVSGILAWAFAAAVVSGMILDRDAAQAPEECQQLGLDFAAEVFRSVIRSAELKELERN